MVEKEGIQKPAVPALGAQALEHLLPRPSAAPVRPVAAAVAEQSKTLSFEEKKSAVFDGLKALSDSGGGFVVDASGSARAGEGELRNDFMLVEFKLGQNRVVADENLKAYADKHHAESNVYDYVRVLSGEGEFREMSLMEFARMQRLFTDSEGNNALKEVAGIGADPAQIADPAVNIIISDKMGAIQKSGVVFYIEDEKGATQFDWRIAEFTEDKVRIQRQDGPESIQEAELDPASFAILQDKWLSSPAMKALWTIADVAKPMKVNAPVHVNAVPTVRKAEMVPDAAQPEPPGTGVRLRVEAKKPTSPARQKAESGAEHIHGVPGLLDAKMAEYQKKKGQGKK